MTADRVTRESAQLADNSLARQADHQRGAVIAFGRAAEGAHQELVHLLQRHHHRAVYAWLVLRFNIGDWIICFNILLIFRESYH